MASSGRVLDYHHIKMGRGSAQVRIKLRNVKRGQTIERTFQAGEKWPRARLDRRPVQALYRDGDDFHFMDTESYEQFVLTADQLGDAVGYVVDGMTLDRTTYQGETIGVELPITVEMLGRAHRARASPATRRAARASPPRSRPASSCRSRSS